MRLLKALLEQYRVNKRCKALVKRWERSLINDRDSYLHARKEAA